MNDSKHFNLEYIRRYYAWGDKVPLLPDHYTETYGEMYYSYIKSAIALSEQGESIVLCGYFADNIKTEILSKLTPSIFVDNSIKQRVVATNLLYFRFLQDFVFLDCSRDDTLFLYLFENYLCQAVGKSDIFSEHSIHWKSSDLLRASFASCICATFCALHETVHLSPSLYERAVNLIRTKVSLFRNAKDEVLSEDEIKELACDFSALYEMVTPTLKLRETLLSKFSCTAEDIVCFSYVALHAEKLYSLFRQILFLEGKNTLLKEKLKEFLDVPLKDRIKNLEVAMKVTQNSINTGFDIGTLDLSKSLQQYGDLIARFLDNLGNALLLFADRIKQVTDPNSSDVMIKTNEPLHEKNVWFLVG